MPPQKTLRFCREIKFAPCGVCNRTQDIADRRNRAWCGWKARFDQSEQGSRSRLSETSQDGGPIDSKVLSTILRQPHLLHENVPSRLQIVYLLDIHGGTDHFLCCRLTSGQDQDTHFAPSRSDVNVRMNAKQVKSTMWHACHAVCTFPTLSGCKAVVNLV